MSTTAPQLPQTKSTVERVRREIEALIGTSAVQLSEGLGRLVVANAKDVTVPGFAQCAPAALASFATESFKKMISEQRVARARVMQAIGDIGNGAILGMKGETRWQMVLQDATEQGMWRTQSFDLNGFSGHMAYPTRDQALSAAVSSGFTERDDAALDRVQATPAFQRGLIVTDLIFRINSKALSRDEGDRLLAEYDASVRVLHSTGQMDAQAFITASGETIYLLADRIDEGKEQAVFLHEIVHRYGRPVLGPMGWGQVVGTLKSWAGRPHDCVENQIYAQASSKAQRAAGAQQPLFDEELLAYAVEIAVGMGLKPSAAANPASAEAWLEAVSATLRAVTHQLLGVQVLQEMDAQQLVDLSYALAQLESPERMGRILERMSDAEAKVIQDLFARLGVKAQAPQSELIAPSPAPELPVAVGSLLAPNGKPSLLNRRLHALVRTEAFKAWFGDWEKDPVNASKVLDANGEPMPHYHGSTKAGFTEFETKGNRKTDGTGAFFANNRSMARGYAGTYDAAPIYLPEALLADPSLLDDLEVNEGLMVLDPTRKQWKFFLRLEDAIEDFEAEDGESLQTRPGYEVIYEGRELEQGSKQEALSALACIEPVEPGIYEVFLNVRDMFVVDWEGKSWDEGPAEKVWNVCDLNGDVHETAYSQEELDVILKRNPGFTAQEDDYKRHETTDGAAREARDCSFDGLMNVWDTGPFGGADDGDVIVVFNPHNIKSTENMGSFDVFAADIRYSIGQMAETSAFDTWFADSKIKDAQGEPLVLYHGGLKWSEADLEAAGRGAVWVTDSYSVAAGYADQFKATEAEVKPLYVRMCNPLDLRDEGVCDLLWPEGVTDSLLRLDRSYVEHALRYAQANGFDGLIHPDSDVRNRGSHVAYAVFSPGQLKLAPPTAIMTEGNVFEIANREEGNGGLFALGNPDIRFSAADERDRRAWSER